ncbi:DUF2806 domain-containing protein [Sulfurimonas sp. NWX367]|uniref:DUF2806 domain-containing protein n=1 Tax=unclassified Sulfurimonas TaxID=2623549 RepID=UPI003204D3B0
MEIKDLTGLSKPLTKLVEVASKGIGTLYKPRAIRKEADAEAKKILIEGEAKLELLSRVQNRVVNQEINRQINLEEIIEKSIPHLDENVTDEEVDDDWRMRFFQKAQDVSSDEMQEIWSQILANEVSKPGRISLRTLEVVSNISKNEAEIFQTACSLTSNNTSIYKFKNQTAFDKFGLTYSQIILLRDAGLIYDNDNLVSILKKIPQINITIWHLGDKIYQITDSKNPNREEYRFEQIKLTVAGEELCRLLNIKKNTQYTEEMIKEKSEEGLEIKEVQT